MLALVELFAIGLLLAMLPSTFYLVLLTLAGWLPARRQMAMPFDGRIAIVVPAHNESAGIGRTLSNLLGLARADGNTEVFVVADNCDDATADIAATLGARVLVRNDASQRGKGYALDYAFSNLLREDYAAFVVIDADSQAADNFIDSLRRHFGTGAVALQSRYTVLNGNESPRTQLAEMALAAFNVLRPRGRDRLGLSVGILGNGFALRRRVLETVPYSAASVVEDLEYHLKLIEAGMRVEFMDDTEVRGEMPTGERGRDTQRARWEGGRLRMLIENGFGLLWRAVKGRPRLLEPLADLLLLPLAYHVMTLLLCVGILLWSGNMLAVSVGLLYLFAVFLHILVALRVNHLPLSRLLLLARIPGYLLWKTRMLAATLATARRHSAWVRTDRDGS